MVRVPIQMMGYRCERCAHEWVPRDETQDPRVCPKCKSPYWNIPPKPEQPYEEFRDTIRNTLRAAAIPLTWTDIRTQAGLKQKFPNNKWVRRMEQDIGLVRDKGKHGIILWSIEEGEAY